MSDSGPVAEPRDAATVVVVRESEAGIEIFCVERHRRSGFLGGAIVFPGGKVDPSDHDPEWDARCTPLGERTRRFAADAGTARAFAVAALREALEEAAILPIVGDAVDDAQVVGLRAALAAPSDGVGRFASLLGSRGLVLDVGRLDAVSRWITPTFEPRRFDTRFYLLDLPRGQRGAHDDRETTKSFWATPQEILARWEAGEILLAPPTSWTVALFSDAKTVADARAVARRQSLEPITPHLVPSDAETVLTLPGDPLHPETGPVPHDPSAPTRFVMEGSRFVPRRAR